MSDHLGRSEYELAELAMASVAMFLFKEGSRNAFNSDRKEANFKKNYRRLFGMRLPRMDTVGDVFRELRGKELEGLKASLVAGLIEKRVFHKFKFLGRSSSVAADATGIASFGERHCPNCLTQTKNGKTIYFHAVLEAKLVTSNGFSISLASEWVASEPERDYDKQGFEMKAFVRLSAKLKKHFPRLPITITADGLYPNKTFFDVCGKNQWGFVVTFKDGNLPSVWEEIRLLPERRGERTERLVASKSGTMKLQYRWRNNIEYKGHVLHFIECRESATDPGTGATTTKRFVHLSSVAVDAGNADAISRNGRMRWKIEDEGFNAQKNCGYEMEHKYSRVSFLALKNYCQTLQIAHLINQLTELSLSVQELFGRDNKLTAKHLRKRLVGFVTDGAVAVAGLEEIAAHRVQIRLRT